MPNINRIRVNNVKYNFGTQMYDDFVMRFHGSDTIYDLANGGGKSVLMLLMMQNMIPNCTLDEKQPIEKLFRTEGGSKTIHSLIEWNLDESDIEEDYRYMLTGFCARKSKDSSDSEESKRDTASIEYFNYCIFYRAYNSNDIVNLPLDKDGERITYSGLKDYLKQIGKELAELKVYVFDRKGEYQQFISRYGIYESAWEIVRGINKTEGHVRTYFETNYRTTRKVVEDLLIEEIIEKSFRDKTEGEDVGDSMAKTLLDIRDKLMELSEKKSEISRYDRQKEVLNVLSGRVSSLSELYKEKDELTIELLSAYRSIENEIDKMEAELKAKKKEIEEVDHECVVMDRNIACMKVQREEYALARAAKEEKQIEESYEQAKKEVEEAKFKLESSENANDYAEYAKVKKNYEEQSAIIAKGKGGAGDTIERLYDYASVKKMFMDERLKSAREKASAAADEEHKYKVALKSLMTNKRDLECALAVADSDKNRLKKSVDKLEKKLNSERKKTSLLLLEDASKLLREQERKQFQAEKQYRKTEEELNNIDAMRAELRLSEAKCVTLLENAGTDTTGVTAFAKMLEDGRARTEALMTAYKSDLSGETLDDLLTQVRKKYKRAVAELSSSKREEKEINAQIEAYKEGRMLGDTTALLEIADYISERHELNAELGQDYILAKDLNDRADLINNWHFLANGIVIIDAEYKDIEALNNDEYLRQMLSERIIPIFAESSLFTPMNAMNKGVVFLHGNEKGFVEDDGFAKDIVQLDNKLERHNVNRARIEDILRVYEDDYCFVVRQIELSNIVTSYENSKEVKETPDYQAELDSIREQLSAIDQREVELKEALEAVNAEGAEIVKEVEILTNIEELYKEYLDSDDEYKKALSIYENVKADLDKVSGAIEADNAGLKDVRERKKNYDAIIADGEKQWNESYAEYYQGRPVLDLGYNEEQLDAEFMSMKAVVEKKLSNFEDKRTLVDTLHNNMEKLLKSLKRRGADIEELAKLYVAGDLIVVSSNEIDKLSANVKAYEKRLDEVRTALSEATNQKSKLEGAIEHGKRGLQEQGISYQRLDVEESELVRILEEQNKSLHAFAKQKATMTEEFIQGQKMMSKKQDFYKDVKRLKELYHLDITDESKLKDVAEYSMDQLKKSREAFEQSMRKEQRARLDLEDYKNKAAETMTNLGAFELAEVIKRDVILPDNVAAFDDLIISLNDMIGFIALEQERVEQGIQDMELIKNNFENQCLLRCQDVKTELSRLAKLSGITLDNEPIQMISLSIPYLNDEEQKESMSAYIDEIVDEVDKYANADERLHFIRTRLSLKKLFSAVVSDMNAIKLLLYKRERIREQSRYLKYEEAVGSTGQSQGIYIQFLISIINYIANLHSVNADNTGLKKVIFIDNPFGAAKDIYIWEPIFEMLKVNNVQLVVPARGATPAITGRFDVNYILGQKLVNGKQQTVVADYRSQVDKTEVEYKKMDFSQGSFDFI